MNRTTSLKSLLKSEVKMSASTKVDANTPKMTSNPLVGELEDGERRDLGCW